MHGTSSASVSTAQALPRCCSPGLQARGIGPSFKPHVQAERASHDTGCPVQFRLGPLVMQVVPFFPSPLWAASQQWVQLEQMHRSHWLEPEITLFSPAELGCIFAAIKDRSEPGSEYLERHYFTVGKQAASAKAFANGLHPVFDFSSTLHVVKRWTGMPPAGSGLTATCSSPACFPSPFRIWIAESFFFSPPIRKYNLGPSTLLVYKCGNIRALPWLQASFKNLGENRAKPRTKAQKLLACTRRRASEKHLHQTRKIASSVAEISKL